jgi:hypothetical protein
MVLERFIEYSAGWSDSLKAWDGYILSSKKISDALKGQGIQGTVLDGANYSPDLWYPYLWMLGGDIIKTKDGHPTKGSYWFPAYNRSAGVKALEFKEQVNAGIKPIKRLTDTQLLLIGRLQYILVDLGCQVGFLKINGRVFLKAWVLYLRFLYLLEPIRVVLWWEDGNWLFRRHLKIKILHGNYLQ